MKQSINLYRYYPHPPKEYVTPHIMSVICLGFLLFLLSISGLNMVNAARGKMALNKIKVQENQLAEKLILLSEENNQKKPDALEEEVTLLAKRLKTNQKIVEVLRNLGFINTKGFSKHFTTLATEANSHLWLEQIRFNKGAREVILSGKAIEAKYALDFFEKLGKSGAFAGQSFKGFRIEKIPNDNSGAIKFNVTSQVKSYV